ncbi:MAG: TAXI family TRAP transporter solute-binding subunit [Betaproteobacteria bacterium]|jgi:TRAP transporter TAXI family solute receptor|nr:TAXI family TRAP transporter solute-binding subunit [Betaproteobacteria bacterium]
MMKRIRDYTVKELAAVVLPVTLAVAVAFWITFKFVEPAPPRVVVMSTGGEGGAYQAYGLRYQAILAKDGVTLELRPSSGAVENVARLRDPESDVSVAFVQGGVAKAADPPVLETLGSVYYEPLWVFYRGRAEIDKVNELEGKRIAVGPEGSGTRKLALAILDASGLGGAKVGLVDLGGSGAADALIGGAVDAAFIVAGPEAEIVRRLIQEEGIQLMSFSRASAYVARLPYLHKLVLPRGSLDLVRDLPREDVALVAPTADLVTKESLHPAIAYLLLAAAREVHGGPGPFHRAGEFPSPESVDFPLSSQAERFYRSGPPFLQRYLPFWAATLVDRMIVLLVPLFAVAVPLFRIVPGLYAWRVRRKVYRWYGELKFLEEEVRNRQHGDDPSDELARLAEIEAEVSDIRVPLGFAHEVYTLRMHVKLVREMLEQGSASGSTGG